MTAGYIRVRPDSDGKKLRTEFSTVDGHEVHEQYVRQVQPATGTQSSVASSATDTTILAANASRKGATIYNDDANALYLLLASGTASATVYSVRIASEGYYELPEGASGAYTGVIKGIWAADGAGSARVTEFS